MVWWNKKICEFRLGRFASIQFELKSFLKYADYSLTYSDASMIIVFTKHDFIFIPERPSTNSQE